MKSIYSEYNFYDHHQYYVLEPITNDDKNKEYIVFHRDAGTIEHTDKMPVFNLYPQIGVEPKIIKVYGMFGLVRILSGDVIILITQRKSIGKLNGHEVYKATEYELFPFARNLAYLTLDQASDEETYVSLLRKALKDSHCHFSYTDDLTWCLQAKESGVNGFNHEFLWNKGHLQPFLDVTLEDEYQDFSKFLLPIISGFISINFVEINGKYLNYSLITRRGSKRVGARYFSRGIDELGNVSNFAETEQIIEFSDEKKKDLLSFVQVRGSIPMFWGQVTNTKYQPPLVIERINETLPIAKLHYDNLKKVYGNVILINLINKNGYEQPLSEAFQNQINELNDNQLSYYHFDFHKECSKMRWDRIDNLIQLIKPELDTYKYFHKDSINGVLSEQIGVSRTNCIDCLDRTNVVQSSISNYILNQQLQQLNIKPIIDPLPTQFQFIYNNLWADNADLVSNCYSGTGALKTDFTRLGKRTKLGALQDLKNSILRYWFNNYTDGQRQDSMDLLLGKYIVNQTNPSPFHQSHDITFLSTIVLILTTPLFLLVNSNLNILPLNLGYLVSFLSLVLGYQLIKSNPLKFVTRPRLVLYKVGEQLQLIDKKPIDSISLESGGRDKKD